MNCEEERKLYKLKIEAEVKHRQAIPSATIPLGQDKPKGLTRDEMIKQGKLGQESKKAKEQYELHKKSCHICI